MKRALLAAVSIATILFALPAAAADYPAVRVAAGGQIWSLDEDACREDGDVFECTSPTLFGDLFLEGRWHALRSFSIGVNLGYGFSGGTPEVVNSDGSGSRFETRMLRGSVEPRWHLTPDSAVRLQLGLELGFLSVTETLVTFEGDKDTEVGSGSQSSALAGATLALGIPLYSGLDLELGTRLALVHLDTNRVPEIAPNRFGTEYTGFFWVGAYLSLGWSFELEKEGDEG